MHTETFAQLATQKLRAVDCDQYKLSTSDARNCEIVNRASYMMSTLKTLLQMGPNERTIEDLEHEFAHLKNLVAHKLGEN